jgi:hypothetical protein
MDKKWDVFISHASEDKDSFVRPLAISLSQLGVTVWYDEFSLRLGDSLSQSIDFGLTNARFAIVVVSPSFIGKSWPARELGGLVSREISQGRVILPVWHLVNREQVLAFSPTLADKLAIQTQGSRPEDIAVQVLREVRPDLYEKHPRSTLEKLASGEALEALKQQIETVKEELSEFLCPFCRSHLANRLSDNDDCYHEVFECGYHTIDGEASRPCPADPEFPLIEHYDLQAKEMPSETYWKWICIAIPKTRMARKLELSSGRGRTKEEAEKKVRESYARCTVKRCV